MNEQGVGSTDTLSQFSTGHAPASLSAAEIGAVRAWQNTVEQSTEREVMEQSGERGL